MLWLRASASMPVVSRPVAADGYLLLDGGISDAVPYAYMEGLGYARDLIVLTQPKGYRKKPASHPALMRLLLRKYPAVADAMARRHEMYNRQMDEIDRREASGRSLVIRPPRALGISRTEKDPDALERVYRLGLSEAEHRLAELRDWVERR